MAKGVYVGVNSKARKVKKMYIGVSGAARKIKKAYIGVGGVARLFWSGGELAYYGTAPALSYSRMHHTATTVGDYALFVGDSNYAEAYNKSLTKTLPTATGFYSDGMSATTVGNYAIFAGGPSIDLCTSVGAYDSSLTKITVEDLEHGSYDGAATTVGNYALFAAGGEFTRYTDTSNMLGDPSPYVNVYDSSLTRLDSLIFGESFFSDNKLSLSATTIGNYAIFAGGYDFNIYEAALYPNLAAYAVDSSLTLTSGLRITTYMVDAAATTVGNYAIFAGGFAASYGGSSWSPTNNVDAFNSSLTKTSATKLSQARGQLAATTVGDYALFAGGGGSKNYTNNVYDIVDAYDTSLTMTTPTALSSSRNNLAATTVGDYALFAGGGSWTTSYDTVDVYTAG